LNSEANIGLRLACRLAIGSSYSKVLKDCTISASGFRCDGGLMRIHELSVDETYVVRAVEEGLPCHFPAAEAGRIPSHTIDADNLRRMLLGLKVKLCDEDQPRAIRISPLGISISHAVIRGEINLNDACGPGGEALPSLSLQNCFFPEPVYICRARFRHLSFEGSRIKHICGIDLRVEGGLNISHLNSSEITEKSGVDGRGQCWVELSEAEIAGTVKAGHSIFVARPEDRSHEEAHKEPRYALHLRESIIGGGVELYPGVQAIGGISFYLAEISGDILAYGARLVGNNRWLNRDGARNDPEQMQDMVIVEGESAPETVRTENVVYGSAINLNGAQVGGQVRFEPFTVGREDSVVFEAIGNVGMYGTVVEGGVYGSGAQVDGAWTATDARIKGDVFLTVAQGFNHGQDTGFPTTVREDVDFNGSTIHGTLYLNGAELKSSLNLSRGTFHKGVRFVPKIYFRDNLLHVFQAVVSHDVRLSNGQFGSHVCFGGSRIEGNLYANYSNVEGDFEVNLFSGVVEIEDAEKEEDKFKDQHYAFFCGGEASFYGARIAGNLEADGATFTKELNAEKCEIGGTVFLNSAGGYVAGAEEIFTFNALKAITFRSAQISGQFQAIGARFGGGINASNIFIGGKVILSPFHGQKGGKAHTCVFTSGEEIYFANSRIMGTFDIAGAGLSKGLSLADSTVEGGIDLNAVDGEIEGIEQTYNFRSKGSIELFGATVGGQFTGKGAHIGGNLIADNADFRHDIFLTSHIGYQTGAEHKFPFTVMGESRFIDSKVGHNLVLRSASLLKGFNAERSAINGDLTLDRIETSESVNLAMANVLGCLTLSFKKNLAPGLKRIKLNLRNARVNEFDDINGLGLRRLAHIEIEGFDYKRLLMRPVTESSETRGSGLLQAFFVIGRALRHRRLDGALAGLGLLTLLGAIAMYRLDGHAAVYWLALISAIAFGLFFLAVVTASEAQNWRLRENWLNLQYKDFRPNALEYRPGPYERLARYYRDEGFYEDAQNITSVRLTLERKKKAFVLFKPVIWVYWLCFNYGLSPVRAITTFIVCCAIGWGGAYAANYGINYNFDTPVVKDMVNGYMAIVQKTGGKVAQPSFQLTPVMVVTSNTVNTVTNSKLEQGGLIIMPDDKVQASALPCENNIDSLIYALDTFLPAIDLQQETQCQVANRPDAFLWRLGRMLYVMLGWIVTSLTILTLSGILRRQAGA